MSFILIKITRYFHLFRLLASMQARVSLAYRMDVLFWSLITIMWTLFTLFFFYILTNISGEIGGWTRPQIYVLVGTFTIVEAFIWSWLYHSMYQITQSVYDGTLDFNLVKPIDTQFVLSFSRFNYTNVSRLLIGVYVVVANLRVLQITPTLLDWMLYGITLAAGIISLYSIWLMIASLAFYFDRIYSINELIPGANRFMQVPRTVFTGGTLVLLTFLLPLTLITNVPAEHLLGIGNGQFTGFLLCFAAFSFLGSRLWFSHCLKQYSGVGS